MDATAINKMAPIAAPIPIPTFAPVESPLLMFVGCDVGDNVDAGKEGSVIFHGSKRLKAL
jgi:hypothetical protein